MKRKTKKKTDVKGTVSRSLQSILDDNGPQALTIPEVYIDQVVNPTLPDSPERIASVNRYARQVRESVAQMTPEQYAQWKEDYYLGMMYPPFGCDNDDGKGFDKYNMVPHGMSIHGVPKLHPDDE
jgi:hypothetical protein